MTGNDKVTETTQTRCAKLIRQVDIQRQKAKVVVMMTITDGRKKKLNKITRKE